VFCIYLRTNSDLCHLQHKLIGFYNRDEKCLQRGTDWVFKCGRYSFVLKGLNSKEVTLKCTLQSMFYCLVCFSYYHIHPQGEHVVSVQKVLNTYNYTHYLIFSLYSLLSNTGTYGAFLFKEHCV
jgi:hypothetical protein